MHGGKEEEGEHEELRALGQQSDARKDTAQASQDCDWHVCATTRKQEEWLEMFLEPGTEARFY